MISPASISGAMYMAVTPVSSSPFRIAHWTGPLPRSFGRTLAWILMQPRGGISRTLWGKILP